MAEKKNKTLEKARKEITYLTGDEEIRRNRRNVKFSFASWQIKIFNI